MLDYDLLVSVDFSTSEKWLVITEKFIFKWTRATLYFVWSGLRTPMISVLLYHCRHSAEDRRYSCSCGITCVKQRVTSFDKYSALSLLEFPFFIFTY